MHMIAAVGENWEIGNQGELLCHIKEDMKNFKQRTEHKIVVMGRKTLDSLPDKSPLPNRTNIVLTHKDADDFYDDDNLLIMHSVEEIVEYCKDSVAYCIGGGEIYEQFLPFCKIAVITKIDKSFDADAHCPNLDKLPNWIQTSESESHVDDKTGLTYKFCMYKNTNVL